MLLALQGNLASTSLPSRAQAPAPALPGGTAWSLLLIVGTALVTGSASGGVWLLHRRREIVPPFSLEDCAEAARRACELHEWGKAIEWFERACRLAPNVAGLHGDLGFALKMIGDAEGAMEEYRICARLGGGPEYYLYAAILALDANRSREEVENWIASAVTADPSLVDEITSDARFDEFEKRESFAEIMGGAMMEQDRRKQGRGPDDDMLS
jgi:tetratricopeptide (TPR) repeat protein